jgi:hypothetical protein
MSEAPVYSENKLVSVLQHIGHDIKIGFTDTETVVVKLPTVIADIDADTPGVVKGVTAVYTAVKKLITDSAPIEAAVVDKGLNLSEDGLVIASAALLEADIKAIWATVEVLETIVVGDAKQLVK